MNKSRLSSIIKITLVSSIKFMFQCQVMGKNVSCLTVLNIFSHYGIG